LIVKTLLEFGNPNPYVNDSLGKNAIHIAAAKLDRDTFSALVEKGYDPMLPDKGGNTILHIMAFGAIRDIEYDFMKELIERYGLRLTRNLDNRSPLNLLRSYSNQTVIQRGQPNFKKKLIEFLERKLQEDPTFEDGNKNNELQEAIMRGSLSTVK
jgi:ankyrin repeat protein